MGLTEAGPAKVRAGGVKRVKVPNDSAQTLDRGIQVLTLLGANPNGMTTTDISEALGIHRSIAHRLLSTLSAHGLVSRRPDKCYELGLALVRLSAGVQADLRTVGQTVLAELAEQVGATAELAVCRGNEVVTLLVVEPLHAEAHVSFRAGLSHPVGLGSSGIAILAGRKRQPGEPAAVGRARSKGYAVSRGQVFREVTGVHAPVFDRGHQVEACVGVSLFSEPATDEIGEIVRTAAARLAARIGS